MNDGERICFEELGESDLELMKKWLNTGFVRRWYGKKKWSNQEVAEEYMPMITKKEPTNGFVIQLGQIPIGYIQTYLIRDYPDYNKYVEAGTHVAGMDLFIGEKDFVHKGLGVHILVKFLEEVVFKNKLVECCIVGPEPKNLIAIKVYENAGFKYLKTIQIPEEEEPEYLMEIKRRNHLIRPR